MGVYSPPGEVKIEYDDATGVLQNVSQYIQSFNGISIEQIVEELSGFSETQERSLPVGKDRVEPIELSGVFRTGAGSVHELFVRTSPDTPDSATRTLKITFQSGSGGLFVSMETYVGQYNRTPERNALTKFMVRLVPASGRTEGTNP